MIYARLLFLGTLWEIQLQRSVIFIDYFLLSLKHFRNYIFSNINFRKTLKLIADNLEILIHIHTCAYVLQDNELDQTNFISLISLLYFLIINIFLSPINFITISVLRVAKIFMKYYNWLNDKIKSHIAIFHFYFFQRYIIFLL